MNNVHRKIMNMNSFIYPRVSDNQEDLNGILHEKDQMTCAVYLTCDNGYKLKKYVIDFVNSLCNKLQTSMESGISLFKHTDAQSNDEVVTLFKQMKSAKHSLDNIYRQFDDQRSKTITTMIDCFVSVKHHTMEIVQGLIISVNPSTKEIDVRFTFNNKVQIIRVSFKEVCISGNNEMPPSSAKECKNVQPVTILQNYPEEPQNVSELQSGGSKFNDPDLVICE